VTGPLRPRPPDRSRDEAQDRAPGDAPVRLAPRERELLDAAVAPLARGGRGPAIVTALVVAAFLLGLLRPWDLLGPPVASLALPSEPRAPVATVVAAVAGTPSSAASVTPPPVQVPAGVPTCGEPMSWRSATIETWVGRMARVWSAVNVVAATGPTDPTIPFGPVVGPPVTAIGWCASIAEADRPPLDAAGTLFRVAGGVAIQIPFVRLEPATPDAMGQLLVPPASTGGQTPPWPAGHYVIRLATPNGSWVRYIGLEVEAPGAVAAGSPAASTDPSPGASSDPSPGASPGPSPSPARSG